LRANAILVTVVSNAATISAGERITATREWVNDRTHKARFLRTTAQPRSKASKNTFPLE
jgi:hypothetical protein